MLFNKMGAKSLMILLVSVNLSGLLAIPMQGNAETNPDANHDLAEQRIENTPQDISELVEPPKRRRVATDIEDQDDYDEFDDLEEISAEDVAFHQATQVLKNHIPQITANTESEILMSTLTFINLLNGEIGFASFNYPTANQFETVEAWEAEYEKIVLDNIWTKIGALNPDKTKRPAVPSRMDIMSATIDFIETRKNQFTQSLESLRVSPDQFLEDVASDLKTDRRILNDAARKARRRQHQLMIEWLGTFLHVAPKERDVVIALIHFLEALGYSHTASPIERIKYEYDLLDVLVHQLPGKKTIQRGGGQPRFNEITRSQAIGLGLQQIENYIVPERANHFMKDILIENGKSQLKSEHKLEFTSGQSYPRGSHSMHIARQLPVHFDSAANPAFDVPTFDRMQLTSNKNVLSTLPQHQSANPNTISLPNGGLQIASGLRDVIHKQQELLFGNSRHAPGITTSTSEMHPYAAGTQGLVATQQSLSTGSQVSSQPERPPSNTDITTSSSRINDLYQWVTSHAYLFPTFPTAEDILAESNPPSSAETSGLLPIRVYQELASYLPQMPSKSVRRTALIESIIYVNHLAGRPKVEVTLPPPENWKNRDARNYGETNLLIDKLRQTWPMSSNLEMHLYTRWDVIQATKLSIRQLEWIHANRENIEESMQKSNHAVQRNSFELSTQNPVSFIPVQPLVSGQPNEITTTALPLIQKPTDNAQLFSAPTLMIPVQSVQPVASQIAPSTSPMSSQPISNTLFAPNNLQQSSFNPEITSIFFDLATLVPQKPNPRTSHTIVESVVDYLSKHGKISVQPPEISSDNPETGFEELCQHLADLLPGQWNTSTEKDRFRMLKFTVMHIKHIQAMQQLATDL